MVGVLIRMKLTILRNAMTGGRLAWMIAGGVTGVLLGITTIWFGQAPAVGPEAAADLLAAIYLTWLLGWVASPLWTGPPVLRTDHFLLLGLPRRRLAAGLLGASFVGVTAVVTLITFLSLMSYATRLGLLPVLLAVPVTVLQLVIVVLAGRVGTGLLVRLARARTGAVVTGVFLGGLQVLIQSGWMLLVGIAVSGVLESGFPDPVAAGLRLAPSGWGLAVVEAAGRGSWPAVLGGLAGMVAFVLVMLLVWSRAVGAPPAERATIRGGSGVAPGRVTSPTGAVVVKELRAWRRDPGRAQAATVPVVWAFGTALLPLTFGSTVLLPWAAPMLALMAATAAVNFLGDSGTALWLTLQTGAERAEIRGRQIALLLVFGPVVALSAVVCTAWSGVEWAWPWVLALTPALLGGGIGLVAWLSVVALVPDPDPHRSPGGRREHADVTAPAFVQFWAGLLPALPAGGLVLAGELLDHEVLRWSGVPVGVLTGVGVGWWLGRVAHRRLRRRGPELLELMRTTRPPTSVVSSGANRTPDPHAPSSVVTSGSDRTPDHHAGEPAVAHPRWRAAVAIIGWVLGPLAVFPQGLVPMVFMIVGVEVQSWFVVMHLAAPLRWPVAVLSVAAGAALLAVAVRAAAPERAPSARGG